MIIYLLINLSSYTAIVLFLDFYNISIRCFKSPVGLASGKVEHKKLNGQIILKIFLGFYNKTRNSGIFLFRIDLFGGLTSFIKKFYHDASKVIQGFYLKLRKLFFPIREEVVLISIVNLFVSLIYLTVKIYQDLPAQNQHAVYIAIMWSELCFWIIISYYIGIGAWSILEIPVYILKRC